MAYSEELAGRIREAFAGRAGLVEKKMFGGVAFMVEGHMCCGVVGEEMMVRVGPDAYPDALKKPHAREMDFTGHPMKGMVYVGAAGCKTVEAAREWVRRGLTFVESLPPK